MTLHAQLKQQLDHLGDGGPVTLSLSAPPRDLHCELVERTRLAVSLDSLRLSTTELAAATAADLERISAALAQRLTYLMEPISPVELDAEGCVVQLRSNPPQRDDDGHAYYELTVHKGGELRLRRYRKDPQTVRTPIPTTVTREVLLRLVDDFCAVLE
jgi:hypothetical protein